MIVFVDTAAFVALTLREDDGHERARRVWRDLEKKRAKLLTSDWVFGETVSFLRRRAGYDVARDVGERLRASRLLEIAAADPDLVEGAWSLFLSHPFPNLSLVDCVSFALMHERKARLAFTFDGHFQDAGFELLPAR